MEPNNACTSRKERPLLTYHCSSGYEVLGLARSLTEFCRATGCDRNYVLNTGNEEQIALATAAGHGRYLERRNAEAGWETRVSRIVLAEQAAAEARSHASGQGNQAAVKIRVVRRNDGQGPLREVWIDGELRGYWRRKGSHLVLCDTTGHECMLRNHWGVRDGVLQSYERIAPASVWMTGWSEAQAIRNASQAWEEGQLPSVPEQEAAEGAREAAQAAKQRATAMMARLVPHAEALEEFLSSAPGAAAAALLDIMRGTHRATQGNTVADGDGAR